MSIRVKIPPSLQHRNFALLWGGLLISVAGSQMQLWALFWHVRELSPDPIAVSGIGAARFVPILLFSLIAGVVADRYDRRKIMFITQTVMMLVATALGVLTLAGVVEIWHLYLLTAIQAIALSFDLPARQALVPNLVPRRDLTNGYSLISIAFNTGSIVGPALSGLVIAYVGQAYVYLFNAVSYLGIIFALVLMTQIQQEKSILQTRTLKGGLLAIKEGIQFIRFQPIILSSMLLDFFATFFSSANTLLPYVARDILNVDAIGYGWLSAAQSIGAISVGFYISQRSNIQRQGLLLLAAVVFFGLATILFGMSAYYWLTMLALILMGGADSVSTILRNTIRQLQTPDYIRGRMVSINQIFFSGGPQLGEVEAGLVAQAFGIIPAIVSGGVGCILAVVFINRFWPQLRKFNGYEPEEPELATS